MLMWSQLLKDEDFLLFHILTHLKMCRLLDNFSGIITQSSRLLSSSDSNPLSCLSQDLLSVNS